MGWNWPKETLKPQNRRIRSGAVFSDIAAFSAPTVNITVGWQALYAELDEADFDELIQI